MSMLSTSRWNGGHRCLRQKKKRLTVDCDEAWSFVGNKGHKQWLWLAMNRETCEIVGGPVGDRSRDGARAPVAFFAPGLSAMRGLPQ